MTYQAVRKLNENPIEFLSSQAVRRYKPPPMKSIRTACRALVKAAPRRRVTMRENRKVD